MSPPREVELKLAVSANSIARLSRSPLLKGAASASRRPATLVSVYFDTAKLKLRKNGLSLRVRRINRRHVQTIKEETGESAALFARNEWEHDVSGERPDLDMARDTALEPLLSKKLRRGLRPVFETRVRRRVYPIHRGQSEVELTIDRGQIEAGRQSSPLCEVELELKQGEAAELFKLARELGEQVPVQVAVNSKADRGYALITREQPAAVKAAPVALTPDCSAETAFQAIARACLRQLIANEPAMQGGDPEAVHQMRVALRRMRAAISLFSAMLVGAQTDALKAEFKWISEELGPARELDVFIKRVVKPVAHGKPNGSGMAVLARDLRKKSRLAFVRAQTAIGSARFRGLVLDTAAWIESGEWTHNDDEPARALRARPIAAAATEELRRHRRKILTRGAKLEELDPQRRHKLRIRAKKLRYASEFFAGAFPGRKSWRRRQEFVAGLEQLQDALGDLNDITVHEELTERIVDGRDASGKPRRSRANRAFAAGRLSGREEARVESVLKDAQRAYRVLAKAKPFWP
jgi:inorganic triphosphatase YgiF